MGRLMKTHKLVFVRTDVDNDELLIDSSGQEVSNTSTRNITAWGSLQPFSKMNNRKLLPEGAREEDYKVFYTKVELRTVDEAGAEESDVTTYKGKDYRVIRMGDWTDFGLRANHGEYYLELIQLEPDERS